MDAREAVRAVIECWPREHLARRHPKAEVWALGIPGLLSRRRGRVASRCQDALFRSLAAAPSPVLICHPESPREHEVPGEWQEVGPSTWYLPRSLDLTAGETRHWLFALGNWTVYGAPEPVLRDWPDPFRTDPERVIEWMEEHAVGYLVDSFHDNTDWLVALT